MTKDPLVNALEDVPLEAVASVAETAAVEGNGWEVLFELVSGDLVEGYEVDLGADFFKHGPLVGQPGSDFGVRSTGRVGLSPLVVLALLDKVNEVSVLDGFVLIVAGSL